MPRRRSPSCRPTSPKLAAAEVGFVFQYNLSHADRHPERGVSTALMEPLTCARPCRRWASANDCNARPPVDVRRRKRGPGLEGAAAADHLRRRHHRRTGPRTGRDGRAGGTHHHRAQPWPVRAQTHDPKAVAAACDRVLFMRDGLFATSSPARR